jgi:hypothetical protein
VAERALDEQEVEGSISSARLDFLTIVSVIIDRIGINWGVLPRVPWPGEVLGKGEFSTGELR